MTDYLLEFFDKDKQNYLLLISLFCAIELTSDRQSTDTQISSEQIIKILQDCHLDAWLCKKESGDLQRVAGRFLEVYDEINRLGLISNPAAFFHYFAPTIVNDWHKFMMATANNKYLVARILYAIYDQPRSDSRSSYQLFDHTALLNTIASQYDDDSDDFINAVDDGIYAIAGFSMDHKRKSLNAAMMQAIKSYNEEFGENSRAALLQDYLSARINPLDDLLARKNIYLRRLVSRATPCNMIYDLRYHNDADDSEFECNVLLPIYLAHAGSTPAIFNPSPKMIERINQFELCTPLTLIIPDELERAAYKQDYERNENLNKYISPTEAVDEPFSSLLVIANGISIGDVYEAFSWRAAKNRLMVMMPQTVLGNSPDNLSVHLNKAQLFADTIINVPPKYTCSAPKKKFVLMASSRKSSTFRLIRMESYDDGDTLSFVPEYQEIESDWLEQNMTLYQMQRAKQDQIRYPLIEHRKAANTICWSPEIVIFYNLYKKTDGYFTGRVHFKEIRLTKGGYVHKSRLGNYTEKGLRAKDVDEILQRIEQLPLSDETYSNLLVSHIEEVYWHCPERLSLKTIWFCLRPELKNLVSYDETLFLEMFCGKKQMLSCLLPSQISDGAEVETALRQVVDQVRITACWRQLLLLFYRATIRGYIENNPLSAHTKTVEDKNKQLLQSIKQHLRQRSVPGEQEMHLVKELVRQIPDSDGILHKRCVVDDTAFISFMLLFSPLSVPELRALTWGDIQRTETMGVCFAKITRAMQRNNIVAEYDSYADRFKRRDVPFPTFAANILMERRAYISMKLQLSDSEMVSLPLFAANKSGKKYPPLDYASVRTVYSKFYSSLGIKEEQYILLDGTERIHFELNKSFRSRFFAWNYEIKASTIAELDEGEIDYLLGRQPQAVVDKNYFGFQAEYNLLLITQKLQKWTAPYEAICIQDECAPMRWSKRVTTNKLAIESVQAPDKISNLHVDVFPQQGGDVVRIQTVSNHRHELEIMCWEEEHVN